MRIKHTEEAIFWVKFGVGPDWARLRSWRRAFRREARRLERLSLPARAKADREAAFRRVAHAASGMCETIGGSVAEAFDAVGQSLREFAEAWNA